MMSLRRRIQRRMLGIGRWGEGGEGFWAYIHRRQGSQTAAWTTTGAQPEKLSTPARSTQSTMSIASIGFTTKNQAPIITFLKLLIVNAHTNRQSAQPTQSHIALLSSSKTLTYYSFTTQAPQGLPVPQALQKRLDLCGDQTASPHAISAVPPPPAFTSPNPKTFTLVSSLTRTPKSGLMRSHHQDRFLQNDCPWEGAAVGLTGFRECCSFVCTCCTKAWETWR